MLITSILLLSVLPLYNLLLHEGYRQESFASPLPHLAKTRRKKTFEMEDANSPFNCNKLSAKSFKLIFQMKTIDGVFSLKVPGRLRYAISLKSFAMAP